MPATTVLNELLKLKKTMTQHKENKILTPDQILEACEYDIHYYSNSARENILDGMKQYANQFKVNYDENKRLKSQITTLTKERDEAIEVLAKLVDLSGYSTLGCSFYYTY